MTYYFVIKVDGEDMTAHPLQESIKVGQAGTQKHSLRGTYLVDDRKLRVHISYDASYHFQSRAKCELWRNEEWTNVCDYDHTEVPNFQRVELGQWDLRLKNGMCRLRDDMIRIAVQVMA